MQVPGHITCDICTCPKGETNHWQVAITREGFEGILFQPAEAVQDPRPSGYLYEDLCSQACCVKRLNRMLDDLKRSATTKESVTP